jgi:hypothetical protein
MAVFDFRTSVLSRTLALLAVVFGLVGGLQAPAAQPAQREGATDYFSAKVVTWNLGTRPHSASACASRATAAAT